MTITKYLKRRYEKNGMVVAIYYYKPINLSGVTLDNARDLYSVSLGYASDNMGDVMYIDNFVYTVHDVESAFKTMKMFINAFDIWNDKWVKYEDYRNLSDRYYDLMSKCTDQNRSLHDPCIA